MKIFISYRRSDSLGTTGRIYDRLQAKFGSKDIFMDVDTIPPGKDFVKEIQRAVSECDVLIAIIGKKWRHEEGTRWAKGREDLVRIEISTALQRDVIVLPVLVEGATMPEASELPDDLKPLTHRNAIEISHTRFTTDVQRLEEALEKFRQEFLQKAQKELEPVRKKAPPVSWTKIGIVIVVVAALTAFLINPEMLCNSSSEEDSSFDSTVVDTSTLAPTPNDAFFEETNTPDAEISRDSARSRD